MLTQIRLLTLGLISHLLEVILNLSLILLNCCFLFHGSMGENVNKFLKNFQRVCGGMKPPGATDEHNSLGAFPFIPKEKAVEWLNLLPFESIKTWKDMRI